MAVRAWVSLRPMPRYGGESGGLSELHGLMIHRPWHLYGALCFAPWASVGRCTGRGALTWKALITGNWRLRSIPAGVLDAMIGDVGRTIGFVHLTRPRSARPFTVDDVQRLDRLRPWLAHAFRRSNSCNAHHEDEAPLSTAGAPVRSGQLIVTADAKLVFQTPGLEHRLRILMGEPVNYTRYVPVSDSLPAPILKLIRQITGAANGTSNTPPRMRISTAYGVLTLEAKWLVPAGTLPADVARDPKSLSHSGDDRTPRAPHCPCGARAARKRRDADAGESRHSTCPWQNETCDRGRTRDPTLLGRGSHEKALSNSRCSQFRRARHENLAEPKARRSAPKFAARRIDRGPDFLFRACPVDVSTPRRRRRRTCPGIATFAALPNRPASGGTETPAGRGFYSAPPLRPSRPL